MQSTRKRKNSEALDEIVELEPKEEVKVDIVSSLRGKILKMARYYNAQDALDALRVIEELLIKNSTENKSTEKNKRLRSCVNVGNITMQNLDLTMQSLDLANKSIVLNKILISEIQENKERITRLQDENLKEQKRIETFKEFARDQLRLSTVYIRENAEFEHSKEENASLKSRPGTSLGSAIADEKYRSKSID